MLYSTKIFTNEKCVGCNRCISNCPCHEANVALIEDDANKIHIDPSKCILCGECIRNCMHDARDYSDDTDALFHDLRAGKDISLIAAPALRSNIPEWPRLLGYLKSLGAKMVFDTSFGADICTWAYLRYITQNNTAGLISQPCPVIVNYIERYATDLLPRLAPIHSPAMCTAVYMKKYAKISGAYAFLSPCVAKYDEFSDPNTNGLISYNVTYRKILAYLSERNIDYRRSPSVRYDNEAHGLGAVYSSPGGLRVNVEQYVSGKWIYQVEGEPHACRFLDRYGKESGTDLPFLVDILNCQYGCNIGSGAARVPQEEYAVNKSMYHAQEEAMKNKKSKKLPPGPDFSRFDKDLELSDFYRSYTAKPVIPAKFNKHELEKAWTALKKSTPQSRVKDCRACGYTRCEKMASAITAGLNHPENCIDFSRAVLREQNSTVEKMLEENSTQAEKLREQVGIMIDALKTSGQKTAQTLKNVESILVKVANMSESTERLNAVIPELEGLMREYSAMGDSVVNVSMQTNLLSMNASIEAARAGQHGKGFAVVAGQIRKLSDQSREAAEEALSSNEKMLPLIGGIAALRSEFIEKSGDISGSAEDIIASMDKLPELLQSVSETASKISVG